MIIRTARSALRSKARQLSTAAAARAVPFGGDKVMVTAALNGVLTDPAKFDIPVTPDEMAQVRDVEDVYALYWLLCVYFFSAYGLYNDLK